MMLGHILTSVLVGARYERAGTPDQPHAPAGRTRAHHRLDRPCDPCVHQALLATRAARHFAHGHRLRVRAPTLSHARLCGRRGAEGAARGFALLTAMRVMCRYSYLVSQTVSSIAVL
eukprot:1647829-Prymnesium_polylepis.1